MWKLGRAQEGGKIFRAETQSKDTLFALVGTQSRREKRAHAMKEM